MEKPSDLPYISYDEMLNHIIIARTIKSCTELHNGSASELLMPLVLNLELSSINVNFGQTQDFSGFLNEMR